MPRPIWVPVAYGAVILAIAMGIRQTMGLFLAPVTMEYSWSREGFAMALAAQNLVWGLLIPFVGVFVDRYGPAWALWGGAFCYAMGLLGMATATTPVTFGLSGGVIIGIALSGTTFAAVLGTIARIAPPESRGVALGAASTGGSFGQFAMVPGGQELILAMGWQGALIALAASTLLILPMSMGLARTAAASRATTTAPEWPALVSALNNRSFQKLCVGYFACGLQTVFIALHLPAFVVDAGMSARDGMLALALIGLGNILSSIGAGYLGDLVGKRKVLGGIYLLRGAAIAAFVTVAPSPFVLFTFAFVMGLLWLGTVPLTNGLVAQVLGTANVAMMTGVVFLAHQLGASLGAWLGGRFFDRMGSYDLAWWICAATAVIAALASFSVDEQVQR